MSDEDQADVETEGIVQEDDEIVKQRLRAERFGTKFVEREKPPMIDKQLGNSTLSNKQTKAKPWRKPEFKADIDLITKEEEEKRQSRAARFGVQNTTLSYRPLPEVQDEEKRKERAKKFGVEYEAVDQSGQQNQDLWEARKEQSTEIPRRPEAIHLYGVDLMSTKEVLQYFSEYSPQNVEWIDDSSCNVIFLDEYTAKRAIVSLGQPFKAGEAPELQGLDPGNIEHLPFVWHKGKDFRKTNNKTIPLIYRMATVEDKKGANPAKSSRHLWLKGQRKLKNNASQGKRKLSVLDEDGDVMMGEDMELGNGGRGKKRRKQRRRQPNGKEIAMQDVEGELHVDPENKAEFNPDLQPSTVEESQNQEKDLRDVLKEKRAKNSASGGQRLFSSAAAGILPKFLQTDEAFLQNTNKEPQIEDQNGQAENKIPQISTQEPVEMED